MSLNYHWNPCSIVTMNRPRVQTCKYQCLTLLALPTLPDGPSLLHNPTIQTYKQQEPMYHQGYQVGTSLHWCFVQLVPQHLRKAGQWTPAFQNHPRYDSSHCRLYSPSLLLYSLPLVGCICPHPNPLTCSNSCMWHLFNHSLRSLSTHSWFSH